ncbi:hypothetical protein Aduo_000170 [Ancylostoma duodenale]
MGLRKEDSAALELQSLRIHDLDAFCSCYPLGGDRRGTHRAQPEPGRCRKSMSKCARKRLRRPAFPETQERLRVTWSSDGLVGNRHFERDGKHFIEIQELVSIGDGKYRIQSRIEETAPPRQHPLSHDPSIRESNSQQIPTENDNRRTPAWIEELASSQAGIWSNSRDHRQHHSGSNGNHRTDASAQQPARPRVELHPVSEKREHHHSGRNGNYRTEVRAQQPERPRVEPQPVSEKREEHIREGGEGHRTGTRVDEPIPPRTAPGPVPRNHEKQAPTGAEDHEMDPRMEAGPRAAPVPVPREHDRRVPQEAEHQSQMDLRIEAASQPEGVPLQIPRAPESTSRERFKYYDEIWYEPPDQGSYPRLLFSPRHGWREFTWEEAQRVREIRPMQDNNHIRSSRVQSIPGNEHQELQKEQHQQQPSRMQSIPGNGHREPLRHQHQQQSTSVQNTPENGHREPLGHQHQQQYHYRNGHRGHPSSHTSSVQQGSPHSHSGGSHQNNKNPHSHTGASNGGSQQNHHPSVNRGSLPRKGTVEITTEHKVEQDSGTWIFRRGEWHFEPRGAGGVTQAGPTTTAETFAPAYDSGMWVYHDGAWHYKPSPQPAEESSDWTTSAPATQQQTMNRASGAKTLVKVRKFQKNENQGGHHDLLAKAVLMDTETEKNRYNKDSDTDYNKWYASIRREQRDRQDRKDRPSSPTSKGGYWYTYESVPAREATVVDDQINELSQMQSSLAQYVRKGNLGVMVMINDEEEQEEGDKKEGEGRTFREAEQGNIEASAYTESVEKSENWGNDQNKQEGEDKKEGETGKSQGASYFVREGNIGAHVYTEPAREDENSSGGGVRIVQVSANGGDGPAQSKKDLSLDELKRLLQQKGYNLSEDELKRLQSQKGNIKFRISSMNDQNKGEEEVKKEGEGSTSQGATYFIKEGNMGAHVFTEPTAEGENSSGGRVRIVQYSTTGGDGSAQKKINLPPDEIKRLLQQKGNITIGGTTYFVKEGNMGAYVHTESTGGGENSSGGPVRIVQYSTTGSDSSKPEDGGENSSSTLVRILQGSVANGPAQTKINFSPDEMKRLQQQKGNVTIGGATYFIKKGNMGAHIYTEPVDEGGKSSGGRVRIVQSSGTGTDDSKTEGGGENSPSGQIRIVQTSAGSADGSELPKKKLSLDELKRILQQKGYNLSEDELKRLQSQKGKFTFRISSRIDQNKQEEVDKKEGEGRRSQGASYFVKEGNIGAYVYTEPVDEGEKSSGGLVRIVQSSMTGGDGSKIEGGRESIDISQGSASAGSAQPMKYLSVDEFKRLQPSNHKIHVLKLKDASGIKPCDSEGATSGAGDFWLLRTRPCNKNSPEGRIILPNGDVLRFYGQPQLVNV